MSVRSQDALGDMLNRADAAIGEMEAILSSGRNVKIASGESFITTVVDRA